MIDASKFPLEQNIEITTRVVKHAHEKGIPVEAELGQIGGVEEDVGGNSAFLTDVSQAKQFVEQTKCDSLAVAVGTSHGAYKFSGDQKVHFDRLQEIYEALPGVPLVMHGSSSVPQEEVSRINAAGGRLEGACGVDLNELREVHRFGVVKINVDTDGRLVWMRVHREYFRDHPEGIDFREPGKEYMQAYADFIAARNEAFGSAGKLSEFK